MLAWTIYCALVPLKTDYKLLYTFGNNCGTEKMQCFLSSGIWIPYFVNVWFQKLKYLYPLHGRLFDLHPPPPRRIFRSRGFLMAPLPLGISRILKRGLRLPTLGTRGFSCVWQKFSVSAFGRHIFCQGIAYIGNSKSFWYLKTKKVNTNSVTKIR